MALGGVKGTTILPGNSISNMDAARLREQQEDPNAPQQVMQNAAAAIAAFGKPGEGPISAETENSDMQAPGQEAEGEAEEGAATSVLAPDPEAVAVAVGAQPTTGTRARTSA
jgi:hypothetical protein